MVMSRSVHPIDPTEIEDYGVVFATFNSRDTIAEGDAVYVNASGYILRARADASATMHGIGVAFRGVASGNNGKVVMTGSKFTTNYNGSGFVGLEAFISAVTAGAITGTAPASSGQIAQTIGVWTSQSSIFVQTSRHRQRNELAGSV